MLKRSLVSPLGFGLSDGLGAQLVKRDSLRDHWWLALQVDRRLFEYNDKSWKVEGSYS